MEAGLAHPAPEKGARSREPDGQLAGVVEEVAALRCSSSYSNLRTFRRHSETAPISVLLHPHGRNGAVPWFSSRSVCAKNCRSPISGVAYSYTVMRISSGPEACCFFTEKKCSLASCSEGSL